MKYNINHGLTHFKPMSHFNAPWKRQKPFVSLTFSGGTEMEHWLYVAWVFHDCIA